MCIRDSDTQRVVAVDSLSPTTPTTSSSTPDNVQSLPDGQADFHGSSDGLSDQQILPHDQPECPSVSDWQKNYHSGVDGQGDHASVTDWPSPPDDKVLLGGQRPQRNVSDQQKNCHSYAVPYGQENCQNFTDEQDSSSAFTERQGPDRSFLDTDTDASTAVLVDLESCGCNDQQTVIDEGCEVSRDDKTTSTCHIDTISPEASRGTEFIASAVVMTTDSTGSTYSRPATVAGN